MDTKQKTTFATRIKQARKHAGFSQVELGKAVQVSQCAIHKIEYGQSLTSRRTVAIALACQVDPIWLATGRGEMLKQSAIVPLRPPKIISIADMSNEQLNAEIKVAQDDLKELTQERARRTGATPDNHNETPDYSVVPLLFGANQPTMPPRPAA